MFTCGKSLSFLGEIGNHYFEHLVVVETVWYVLSSMVTLLLCNPHVLVEAKCTNLCKFY